jgi:hypothetical protein
VFLYLALMAMQAVSQPQMAQADRLNGQFVTCLFGAARQARVRSDSPSHFAAELQTDCLTEEMALRAAMLRVLRQRGLTKSAKTKVDAVIGRSRQAVVVAYDRTSSEPKWQ